MPYSWLADLIPPPHTREPLTLHSFLQGILLPILCYYTTAILVILPNTHFLRWTLLPLSLWTTFRGSTRVNLVLQFDDERLVYWNQGFVLAFTTMSMRVITWTFQRKPYRRAHVLIAGTKNIKDDVWSPPSGLGQVAVDAFDLCFNLRGCGWNWSRGLQVPPETRPTTSTAAFAWATFISLNIHFIFFDIMHYSVQWFAPTTIGSPVGGSIFDPTIPPAYQYLRSSTMTLLSGLTVYCAIQTSYLLFTLIGVLIFKQHLSLWPPAFRTPWLATSLTEYWAKRWHQLFRDNFISIGGNPLSWVAGRVGGVLGAFLVSGIFHDLGLWGMGRGSDFLKVVGFFVMMGVGVILEGLWKRISGRRTEGWIGRIWTLAWIIGWGNFLVDAWTRKGLVGSLFIPTHLRPSTFIFGALSFT